MLRNSADHHPCFNQSRYRPQERAEAADIVGLCPFQVRGGTRDLCRLADYWIARHHSARLAQSIDNLPPLQARRRVILVETPAYINDPHKIPKNNEANQRLTVQCMANRMMFSTP